MIAVANLVELLLKRTFAEADITVATDFVSHEANPFGRIPFAAPPTERSLCLFIPVSSLGQPTNLVVVPDGFLVVINELMKQVKSLVLNSVIQPSQSLKMVDTPLEFLPL